MNWGGQSFTYTLPARTSATFTWGGTHGAGDRRPATGGADHRPGRQVRRRRRRQQRRRHRRCSSTTCNGTAAQQWTRPGDGTIRALGKCLDVAGVGTANGSRRPAVDVQRHRRTSSGRYNSATSDLVNPHANKCLDVTGNTSADGTPAADLDLHRRAPTRSGRSPAADPSWWVRVGSRPAPGWGGVVPSRFRNRERIDPLACPAGTLEWSGERSPSGCPPN